MKGTPMRRRATSQNFAPGIRYQEARKNFTDEQLACIGELAVTYTEAERGIHELFGCTFRFAGDPHEIASRINGLDGHVAIIKAAVERYSMTEEQRAVIADTLGAFITTKGLRDAVVHADIFDARRAVAIKHGPKGTRQQVLVAPKALRWACDYAALVAEELHKLHYALACCERLYFNPPTTQDHIDRLGGQIDASIASVQGTQARRRGHGPEPKFPEGADDVLELPPRN